ncbi:MAG TPA: acyltransferase [Pyrinomonadaceae bacterium]|jgi:peptidoglycan/LPS O-acetylase OafA/YrhL
MHDKSANRIPSLDGLRAISIGLVLLAHLSGTAYFPIKHEYLNVGNLGVRVFFVISGFLITGILLREIDKTNTIDLAKFYYRRTLRIFPPYYFFLAMIGLLALAGFLNPSLKEWLSAVFYLSNFTQVQTWEIGHTWSLAVEEQFYLLMPSLLFLGRRRAFWVLCAVILLSPFIRLASYMLYPDPELRWVVFGFQANADSLAIGCLLAFLRPKLWQIEIYQSVMKSKFFLVFPLLALGLNYFSQNPKIFNLLGITCINFCIVLCIDWAVTFHEGLIGKILNSKPLVFVGTLSYSIYLWQQLFLNRESPSAVNGFPFNIFMVFACALISYYLIEKPSLNFRQKFEKRVFGRPAPLPD